MITTSSGRRRAANRQAGFSLGELLTVLAIIGIATAVAIPLVSEQLRAAKVRAAADQYAMSLKAARMIAVSKRSPLDFTVQTDPANTYSYTDTYGRVRQIRMPDGVRIVSSTSPISFQVNGSLPSAATTVIEANLTGGAFERWTVTTSILGVSSIEHGRYQN